MSVLRGRHGMGHFYNGVIEGIADLKQALPRANGVSSYCQHLPVRNLVGHVKTFMGPLYGSPSGPA